LLSSAWKNLDVGEYLTEEFAECTFAAGGSCESWYTGTPGGNALFMVGIVQSMLKKGCNRAASRPNGR